MCAFGLGGTDIHAGLTSGTPARKVCCVDDELPDQIEPAERARRKDTVNPRASSRERLGRVAIAERQRGHEGR